jgi:hypothetical protein
MMSSSGEGTIRGFKLVAGNGIWCKLLFRIVITPANESSIKTNSWQFSRLFQVANQAKKRPKYRFRSKCIITRRESTSGSALILSKNCCAREHQLNQLRIWAKTGQLIARNFIYALFWCVKLQIQDCNAGRRSGLYIVLKRNTVSDLTQGNRLLARQHIPISGESFEMIFIKPVLLLPLFIAGCLSLKCCLE